MIISGIEIPEFGCWEITGQYKDQQLTSTVWVAPALEQEMSSSTISAEPLAQESPPRRIQVDGEVQARSLFYRVTPEIPRTAEAASISGTVVLHAVITTSGRTSELQYLSGPPLLSQAAIDAATWWQYGVAFANDQPDEPVEVDSTINVVFPEPHN
jgi:protein TonB